MVAGMSFTCPKCWRTSYSEEDENWGYCGYCHVFTNAPPVPQEAFDFLTAVIKEGERASGADPEVLNGDQRHRSSSTPAGQEREMRMPTNNEDGKAQPEVPEVQREGDCPGLQQLRRERMEPQDKSTVQPMPGYGLSGSIEPTPPSEPLSVDGYPSKYRFYWGTFGLGMGLGIAWTLSLTTSAVLRHVSKIHVVTFLLLVVAATFAAQGWMLYRWNKALAKHRIELAKFWDEHVYGEPNPWRK